MVREVSEDGVNLEQKVGGSVHVVENCVTWLGVCKGKGTRFGAEWFGNCVVNETVAASRR